MSSKGFSGIADGTSRRRFRGSLELGVGRCHGRRVSVSCRGPGGYIVLVAVTLDAEEEVGAMEAGRGFV